VEGLVNSCPLLDYVAKITPSGAFQLVDIGCSGGIDRPWRRMGRRLRALGIDPDVQEIGRLRKREANPAVSYLEAFAGIAADHPFAVRRKGKPDFERDPHDRLSTYHYHDAVGAGRGDITDKRKRSENLWKQAELADPSVPVVVPDYLKNSGVASVDFLKIDIDGRDFEVLNSFDRALTQLQVVGVGIEVRLWGSDEETDGTFHNVDRFLKAQGFELFNLTLRRYSTSALPSRFVGRSPGATELGRVHHGDAMYARDLASGCCYHELEKSLSPDKVLNLVLIFAIFDLPDCAAEVLTRFRDDLSTLGDVDRMLDLLTAQAERRVTGRASYRAHMTRFRQHPRQFLGRNPLVRLWRAWKKGYLKWRGRMQLLAMERRSP
jgi:FkbM family methyltransferase